MTEKSNDKNRPLIYLPGNARLNFTNQEQEDSIKTEYDKRKKIIDRKELKNITKSDK
jgi:hypothetical protein